MTRKKTSPLRYRKSAVDVSRCGKPVILTSERTERKRKEKREK